MPDAWNLTQPICHMYPPIEHTHMHTRIASRSVGMYLVKKLIFERKSFVNSLSLLNYHLSLTLSAWDVNKMYLNKIYFNFANFPRVFCYPYGTQPYWRRKLLPSRLVASTRLTSHKTAPRDQLEVGAHKEMELCGRVAKCAGKHLWNIFTFKMQFYLLF